LKKILIIGATSAIAEATAQKIAKRGDHLFLVARNQDKLNMVAEKFKVTGGPYVTAYQMDVNDFNAHAPMLNCAEKAMSGINLVLIAHGTLSDQPACEQSVELTMQEIKTNGLSVISLLTHIANRFEKQQNGVIAIISSVAGDRGRQSNYVYGTAKSMVSTFTSGLRQRLHKSGVSVITIKPGFVDTPMTQSFKKGFLWATPDSIAKTICCAIDKKKNVVYAPFFWIGIMSVIKIIPERMFKKITL
jgi:short-subunit dehydrogenase